MQRGTASEIQNIYMGGHNGMHNSDSAALFVFIYPYCLSRDYYELFYDKQQRVLECTREENWGEAQKLMDAMAADFYVKRDSMRFFYDHEDIDEIEGYILSAQELILREGKRTVRIRTYARAYSCRFP